MKTFSRYIHVVFLALSFMLIGNIAAAQQGTPFLEVLGAGVFDQDTREGASVIVTFRAGPGTVPLRITHSGLTNVSHTNNSIATTGPGGLLTVTGTITGRQAVWILAEWEQLGLTARAALCCAIDVPELPAPMMIVVNPPDPKSPLAVGDTFTQTISIENRDLQMSTLPLSAWQMDIVFDPLILEVLDVTEGDFLERDGADAFYSQKIKPGRISVIQARTGQSGISLTPEETGELLTIKFRVLAFGEEALGIHRVKLQSSEDADENGIPDRISYKIIIEDVFVATHQTLYIIEDVNRDGAVDILDLVMVASNILESSIINPRVDINSDGIVDVLDLILIVNSQYFGQPVSHKVVREPNAAAPLVSVADLTPDKLQEWIDLARSESDGSLLFQRGIANLQRLLMSSKPIETRLLLNYPNPFNPETWIPYQLAEATDVTVTIHAMNGSLIRTLSLGHQSAGLYRSKSRAAYWDGKNEFGEQVASGLYFYTLTAGKFSATGKMLIRK